MILLGVGWFGVQVFWAFRTASMPLFLADLADRSSGSLVLTPLQVRDGPAPVANVLEHLGGDDDVEALGAVARGAGRCRRSRRRPAGHNVHTEKARRAEARASARSEPLTSRGRPR
jgi:hypothetical protein